MLKKRTAILFLTLAYAILLGHNITPHHHHDEHLTEHHDTDHHHDNDAENKGLNDLFAHLTHPDDGFSFTTSNNITNTFSKQLSLIAVLPDNFSIEEILLPPFHDKPPEERLVYISPYSLPSGLRAPPATFI